MSVFKLCKLKKVFLHGIVFICVGSVLWAQGGSLKFEDNTKQKLWFEDQIKGFFKKETLERHGRNFFITGKLNSKLIVALLKDNDAEVSQTVLGILNNYAELRAHTDPSDWIAIRDAVIDLLNHKDKELRQSAILTAKVFWQDDNDNKFARALVSSLDDKDDLTVICAIEGLGFFQKYVHSSKQVLDKLKLLAINRFRPDVQSEAVKLLLEFVEPSEG